MPSERTYRALVLGTGTYTVRSNPPINLLGPANDVVAIQEALTHADWGLHAPENVEVVLDQPRDSVMRAIEHFFKSAGDNDQLFLFYSGHGFHEQYERLYLAASDTETEFLVTTAVPVSAINSLAESSRAAAMVFVLDCCYGGILKGRDPALAAGGRGRWLLSGCRRDQGAQDATTVIGLSPFSELVAAALIGGGDLDADGDGFVTVSDVYRHVSPRLEPLTGQVPTIDFHGSGELAVALAPGYPIEFDQRVEDFMLHPASKAPIRAPRVPAALPDDPSDEEDSELPPVRAETDADLTSEAVVWAKVTEALELQNSIRLKLLQQQIARLIRDTVVEDRERFLQALDSATTMIACAVNFEDDWLFQRSISLLRRAYELGYDEHGNRKSTGLALPPAELWLAVYLRVLTLGALATRTQAWKQVRGLILQRPDSQDFRYYPNWLRHALTEAARAELFSVMKDSNKVSVSPLILARDHALGHSVLVPDLGDDPEAILNSLCEFDATAAIVAVCSDDSEDSGSAYYPNFARFYGHRSEPAFARIIRDSEVRNILAPVDDATLAAAFLDVDRVALTEARIFDGWHGLNDPAIVSFIKAARDITCD